MESQPPLCPPSVTAPSSHLRLGEHLPDIRSAYGARTAWPAWAMRLSEPNVRFELTTF